MLLNMGNAGNFHLMLRGYGWTYNQVVDFVEKNATVSELQFAQKVWDFMDEQLYPLVREHYFKTNGVDPGFVKAMPLVLNVKGQEVVLRGGYYPMRTHDEDTLRERTTKDAKTLRDVYAQGLFQGANVAKGFTKARKWNPTAADVFSVNQPETRSDANRQARLDEFNAMAEAGVLTENNAQYADFLAGKLEEADKKPQPLIHLSMGVLTRHVAEVIHYVTYDEGVREMHSLLQDPAFRVAVQRVIGNEGLEQLNYWVKDLAAGRVFSHNSAAKAWEDEASDFKGRLVMATLGYSLSVPMGDVSNLFVAWTSGQVSSSYLKDAFFSDWFVLRDFAEANSQELRVRSNREPEHLRAEVSKLITGKFTVAVEAWLKENAWVTFDAMDKVMSTFIWTAAYNEKYDALRAKNVGADPAQHVAEASKHADHVVQTVMPATDILEKSAVLRSKGNAGALVVFYSWFNKMYNLQRRIINLHVDKYRRSSGLEKAKQPAIMAMKILGTYAAMQLIGEFFSGRGPEPEEDPAVWAMRKTASAPLLMIPVVGAAGEAFINKKFGKGTISSRSNPMGAYVERIFKNASTIHDATDEVSSVDSGAGVKAFVDLLLMARGVPSSQFTRSGDFLYKLTEGTNKSENPLSGVVYGDVAGQNMSILNPAGE